MKHVLLFHNLCDFSRCCDVYTLSWVWGSKLGKLPHLGTAHVSVKIEVLKKVLRNKEKVRIPTNI
jgi:hypothetical protein